MIVDGCGDVGERKAQDREDCLVNVERGVTCVIETGFKETRLARLLKRPPPLASDNDSGVANHNG